MKPRIHLCTHADTQSTHDFPVFTAVISRGHFLCETSVSWPCYLDESPPFSLHLTNSRGPLASCCRRLCLLSPGACCPSPFPLGFIIFSSQCDRGNTIFYNLGMYHSFFLCTSSLKPYPIVSFQGMYSSQSLCDRTHLFLSFFIHLFISLSSRSLCPPPPSQSLFPIPPSSPNSLLFFLHPGKGRSVLSFNEPCHIKLL